MEVEARVLDAVKKVAEKASKGSAENRAKESALKSANLRGNRFSYGDTVVNRFIQFI